ncbi:MAG: 3-methyl-2-oxobutanoate dehydrogenase subunit VorB [Thermodesulfovibrionales bacterium]
MKMVLMQGNQAIAESAIVGGCRFYAGYPITPQNEIPEYLSWRMPQVKGVFIQAESEISAINMVYGASACGVRAMTSSSSPGISLMQETISFLATAQLPAVIVNIQRGGPGLGNISASQSDYFQAVKGGGHGDYRCVVYAPYSVQEMWDITQLSFDRADIYRTPVIILADAILGQMTEPLVMKSISRPMLKKDWSYDRPKGSGVKRVVIKTLHTRDGELEALNYKLAEKYKLIESKEVLYEEFYLDDADLVAVAFGISARITKSAVNRLRRLGYKVGILRPISLYPFPSYFISELANQGKRFISVELNLGQMIEDIQRAVNGRSEVYFYGRPGGGLFTPAEIEEVLRRYL